MITFCYTHCISYINHESKAFLQTVQANDCFKITRVGYNDQMLVAS